MHEALGRPPVMFVDLRPVASPMLVIASYKVAEQIAKSSDRFPSSPPEGSRNMEPYGPSRGANIYRIFTGECLIAKDVFALIL